MKKLRTIRKRNRRKARRVLQIFLSLLMTGELLLPTEVYAGPAIPTVDETLYLNLDSYGGIEKANVVKGVQFNTASSYTDYGSYTSVTNMSTQDPIQKGDGSVTLTAPKDGSTFYFEGGLDPKQVQLPWSFDVSYKLNGSPRNAEDLAGASGLVEIDINALPRTDVSDYMKNNFVLAVMVPVDREKVTSLEAPGAQNATIGQYSGVMFEALPGKEGHFQVRIGSEDFSSVGTIFMMAPVTVSDLENVKDLKDLKDKFRTNTNAMMDDLDALLSNVGELNHTLSLNNQMLQELQLGQNKLDAGKGAIFDGVDHSIQEIQTLSDTLTPIEDSLGSTKSMAESLHQNLQDTSTVLYFVTDKLVELHDDLRSLSEDMNGSTIDGNMVRSRMQSTRDALSQVQQSLQDGVRAGRNLQALTEQTLSDGATAATLSDLAASAAVSHASYEEEYLPESVIELIQSGMQSRGKPLSSYTGEEIQSLRSELAALLHSYNQLTAGHHAGSIRTEVKAEEINNMVTAAVQNLITASPSSIPGTTMAEKLANAKNIVISQTAAQASKEENEEAARFVGRLSALQSLKERGEMLARSRDSASQAASQNIRALTASLASIVQGLNDAYGSTDTEALLNQLSRVISELNTAIDDGSDTLRSAGRVSGSLSVLSREIGSLIDTINKYHPELTKLLDESKATLEQIQTTSVTLSETVQTANNTLRSASENFSAAANDGIRAGKEAVKNGQAMIGNTNQLRNSGKDLRDSINRELDQKEAENNFLNMDPDAVKLSFTSTQNEAPNSLAIIARTKEIKQEKEKDTVMDVEIAGENTTAFQRIASVFRKIWNILIGIFR